MFLMNSAVRGPILGGALTLAGALMATADAVAADDTSPQIIIRCAQDHPCAADHSQAAPHPKTGVPQSASVPDRAEPPTMAEPTLYTLTVDWDRHGPLKVGDPVTLSVHGFPAHARVEIGAGPPNSEYGVITHGTTSDRGDLQTRITVPGDSLAEDSLVFVVSTLDFQHRALSVPIPVDLNHHPAPRTPDTRDLISWHPTGIAARPS